MICTRRPLPQAGGASAARSGIPGSARLFLTGLVLVAGAILAATGLTPTPAAAAPSPPPPPAGHGSIGLRLLDEPVSAGHDPRAQLYIVDHLAPGAQIRRRIEISNTTVDPQPIVLYPAAASIVNGSFVGSDGRTANDVSRWTSISPAAATVPAGGVLVATATVTVAADAPPGEQYGVIWAQAATAPGAAGGVTQLSRVGIRLYLSVGPGNPPAAAFTVDSLTAERTAAGRPQVLATVHNTGGRALDLSGTLTLTGGPGGLSAGPFPATLGTTIAPGSTEPVTVLLDASLPAGPWQARITLRSGLLSVTERATISFPAAGTAAPAAVATAPATAGITWLWPVVGVLLGCVITLLLLLGRRRHVAAAR